ncbi:hypothetical protein M0804_003496 [Polistes exclamans]|nr:hypothetical protein M0804_003496 [Polistes exclamans]
MLHECLRECTQTMVDRDDIKLRAAKWQNDPVYSGIVIGELIKPLSNGSGGVGARLLIVRSLIMLSERDVPPTYGMCR